MELVPKGPPGRITRKARAYHAEICRLRNAGYTLDAIRQALGDAGVEVSISTVRREALHADDRTGRAMQPATSPAFARAAPMPAMSASPRNAPSPLHGTFINDTRTGKQIVEEFMRGRNTNPLLQERSYHEDRRD